MAKRRQLEAPSPEILRDLEAGFARETSRGPLGMAAPIASVAGEAAALTALGSVEDRANAARDKRDADRLREAEGRGLMMLDLSLGDIVADELTRDRMKLDPEEMEELKTSIAAHGLRMPIEVFELIEPRNGARYGLLSGYRRLAAVKALHAQTGKPEFSTIRALHREPGSVAGAFVAMVEENEIRSALSQYERGRIAVLATEMGVYPTIEAALNELFSSGSRAKRSKLRSFAQIHEELGDMLTFPQAMSERAGLRLANALRAGLANELRQALATGRGTDADLEWALMEPIVKSAETAPKDVARGGRPLRSAEPYSSDVIQLANGISIRHETDSRGHAIRFDGRVVDADLIETVMREIKRLLEPI
jgi:ParB family transcriptional regulator, chromosome partitioning protein